MNSSRIVIKTENLHAWYGNVKALTGINCQVTERKVTSLIGPSGCGKSTFLRILNRMNDRIPNFRVTGNINVCGTDPYAKDADLLSLRRTIGMVFQKPSPFPCSIFDNVAMAPRAHYGMKGSELKMAVESALTEAALWNEVKDKLNSSGLSLSGGQQQRLCIARMLAVRPEVILMDEPCSALDPISTSRIEELIGTLREKHSVVVVTHNLQQAERISDYTAFFMFGELVEFGNSRDLFSSPSQVSTQDYVSGRFG